MKKFLISIALILAPTMVHSLEAEYNRTIDGDTVVISLLDQNIPAVFRDKIPVRLRGLDSPPLNNYKNCVKEADLGLMAKEYTKKLMESANKVEIANVSRGKFFRVVADVIITTDEGKNNVGDLLMIKGLALKWDGKTKKPNWCMAPYPPSKT